MIRPHWTLLLLVACGSEREAADLELTADGTILFRGRIVAVEELQAELPKLRAQNATLRVRKADSEAAERVWPEIVGPCAEHGVSIRFVD